MNRKYVFCTAGHPIRRCSLALFISSGVAIFGLSSPPAQSAGPKPDGATVTTLTPPGKPTPQPETSTEALATEEGAARDFAARQGISLEEAARSFSDSTGAMNFQEAYKSSDWLGSVWLTYNSGYA